jgi:hypothetical protein
VTDPNKIETMSLWPVLRDVKGLRVFLELTNCFRRFTRGYFTIAKLLTQLLKDC